MKSFCPIFTASCSLCFSARRSWLLGSMIKLSACDSLTIPRAVRHHQRLVRRWSRRALVGAFWCLSAFFSNMLICMCLNPFGFAFLSSQRSLLTSFSYDLSVLSLSLSYEIVVFWLSPSAVHCVKLARFSLTRDKICSTSSLCYPSTSEVSPVNVLLKTLAAFLCAHTIQSIARSCSL